MSTFLPPSIAEFLAGRTQEIQTVFGIQVVLVLVVLALVAGETIRTREVDLPGGTRLISVTAASLLLRFATIVIARLGSIT